MAISIPHGLSREEERRLFVDAHLKEARRLSVNLDALRERGMPNIAFGRGLFGRRAESLASFQNRYWSRLLEPQLVAYLIDLEGKLRLVDTCLDIYLNYLNLPQPNLPEGVQSLRDFEVASSQQSLLEAMQQLLVLVVDGIDKGLVPRDRAVSTLTSSRVRRLRGRR